LGGRQLEAEKKKAWPSKNLKKDRGKVPVHEGGCGKKGRRVPETKEKIKVDGKLKKRDKRGGTKPRCGVFWATRKRNRKLRRTKGTRQTRDRFSAPPRTWGGGKSNMKEGELTCQTQGGTKSTDKST